MAAGDTFSAPCSTPYPPSRESCPTCPTWSGAFGLDQERLTAQPGDFFVDPLPAADAYVLMEVIHDWDDEASIAILSAIRRAAPPGAAVLVIEGVVRDEQPDPRAQTLDIIMLTVTGGRERTASQLRDLFHRAGWQRSVGWKLSGGY